MSDKHLQDIQSNEVNQKLDSHDEFPATEAIPVLDYLNDNLKKTKASRRDFLKAMGFSVSAAALAASCDIPVKKAIPYVNKPENLTPGKALYYATSYFDGRNFSKLLAKVREGRPILLEPNKDANLSAGPAVLASLISLYDTNRIKKPQLNGKHSNWVDAIQAVKQSLSQASGQKVLLTGPIISPSVKSAIQGLTDAYGVKHIVYSTQGADALLKANQEQFGKKAAPLYHFDKADVIASFGADFLGSWLGGECFYAKDYSSGRKISPENPKMSKHYQVESHLSLTGSNADKRLGLKPSQMKAYLFQLHNILAAKLGGTSISGVPTAEKADYLEQLAEDLIHAKQNSLVVCGVNDVDCQKATNAINRMLGSYGTTIDFSKTLNTIQSDTEEFTQFVSDLKNGRIGTLLLSNVNPVFNEPNGAEIAEAFKSVDTIAAFDGLYNETTTLANVQLPEHHYLEAWNEYEPVSGSVSMAQPVITNLFDTQPIAKSLMQLAGAEFSEEQDDAEIIQERWKTQFGNNFQSEWDNAIQNGGRQTETASGSQPAFSASSINFSAPNSGDVELVFFEDKLGDGSCANNPYMQELPDPVSKVSWDNYAALSPAYAKAMGVYVNRNVNPAKESTPLINLTANGKTVKIPVLVQPGTPYGVIAIPKGYGKSEGLIATGVGVNPMELASSSGSDYVVIDSFEKAGKGHELPQTQIHYTIDDDRPTVREATLADYKENQDAGNYFRYMPEFEKAIEPTLYPKKDYPGHHWGMSVDLNACTGCGACVVACNIENNIPVVGKKEVANQRDMHWLRIDRYFASTDQDPKSDTYMEDPSVVFMPMMCQHCDNAPCENVCPVNATNHSTEGLNQMAYNRCIGTRYCANNCPFKVRRFNWFDYWGADAWGPGNDLKKEPVNQFMREDMTRMILNPDVTVRSRGVIEKCSFCVQRIQEVKLDAKIEGKAMESNAIKTACQSACPANAITFGDVNNSNSEVAKRWDDKRNYFVLEEFHIKPSVGYMTKITNSDVALFDKTKLDNFPWKRENSTGGHGDDHGGGHGDDSHGGKQESDHGTTEEHH